MAKVNYTTKIGSSKTQIQFGIVLDTLQAMRKFEKISNQKIFLSFIHFCNFKFGILGMFNQNKRFENGGLFINRKGDSSSIRDYAPILVARSVKGKN